MPYIEVNVVNADGTRRRVPRFIQLEPGQEVESFSLMGVEYTPKAGESIWGRRDVIESKAPFEGETYPST